MALTFSNITHQFDHASAPALNDVSLSVAAGDILCLFGPSGCGKTTLLRLAAGHESVQTGTITLDGQSLAGPGFSVAPQDRPIGFVFQDYVLFPHLTVGQNIRFGLRHLSRREQDHRAHAQMARLGIAGFEKRFPHELSGGQQQRVAIARALARQPSVLLLDEPFASLDIALRQSLQAELRAILKDNGVSVIFVTHEPGEALMMGDRLALLQDGRVRDEGTPEDLYTAPASRASAMVFRGRQSIKGTITADGIETSVGNFGWDGPYRPYLRKRLTNQRPANGVADIIIETNQLTVTESTGTSGENRFTVTDCRFVGPHWRVFLAATAQGDTGPDHIHISTSKPYSKDQMLSCRARDEALVWVESLVAP